MVLIGNILSAVTDVNVTDCNKLSVEVQDLYPKIYICTCSQVVKALVCKTSIRQFKSVQVLQKWMGSSNGRALD